MPIPFGHPPPPPTQYPNRVKNTEIWPKTCFTYLGWSFQVITVSKKNSNTSTIELPGVKNFTSRLCANPLGDPPPPPVAPNTQIR